MRRLLPALFFIACSLCILSAGAQKKMTIDNVYSVKLNNSGPILEKEQVKGYFFFYQSDKVDKKTNEYTLRIADENLNVLKDVKFNDSKNILLLESSYNGSAIIFVFYNDDESTIEYRLFGMDGKQKLVYSKTLDKKSKNYFKQAYNLNSKEETENKNIYDIPDKGFISVTAIREDKKYTYEVNFYSSEKRKTWTYDPIETGKFAQANYLGSNDSIAVLEVLSKERLMSKEIESHLVGINLETGKKVFEVRTQDGKHKMYPMSISTIDGNNSQFLIIGPYYGGEDKMVTDKTEGLGVWLMNNQGKLVKTKYITWARDLAKFAKVDQKGKLADIGYLYFHKVMQTEDGRIFAVGEGYKKVADGVGIALTLLTQRNQGVTKMVVTDLVMLQLNKNFELENARIFEKNQNNFSHSGGYDFVSPHAMAQLLKVYGMFDYRFTQMAEGKSSFVTGYTDYEKSKDYKGMTFHAVSYYEGKLNTDKITLHSKASSSIVMPAKPGFVLVFEYYKKEKKVDARLEKVN